ncbi:MAG: nucleotidyltransferase domain-containing protein [Kiritimatiellae bacterium]|nr:nucleotidyltransferase domain-containing protein [Kiritimatiellia bacterium]
MIAKTDIETGGTKLAEVRNLARQYALETREHFKNRLRRICLYGSAARGDWSPESDIDILVLLDHIAGDDERWLICRATELGVGGSGILIQPLFMAESDFARLLERERLFAIEVQREGMDL